MAIQIAHHAAAHGFHALAFHAQAFAVLRAFGNVQLHAAGKRGHFHFAAQCRGGETDGQLAMQIGGVFRVALEDFVRAHGDVDVQIARRRAVHAGFALACQTDALAVVDARGDIDFHRFGGLHAAFAVAAQAGFFNLFARTVAGGAGLLDLENGLAHVHGARTAASVAGGSFCAGFRARAVAHVAFGISRNGDLLFHAGGRLFQRDFHAVLHIRTLVIRLTRTAATAEHLAENIAEVETASSAEAAKSTAAARTAEAALFERGVAVLVVCRFFLRVGQSIVGFLDFFEFFFGFFIVGIAIGMVFHRQLAVGLFDFVVACGTRNAQYFVKIFIAHVNVFKIKKEIGCWLYKGCPSKIQAACTWPNRALYGSHR